MSPYYDRAGITLYCGDCRDVLQAIGATGVDLVLADPPYGVSERTERRSTRIGSKGRLHRGAVAGRDWPAVVGDDAPFDPSPWLAFPKVILWGANHYADRLPPSRAWLVWDKRCGTTPDDNADCDLAWTNLPGPARHFAHLWRGVCRDSEAGMAPLHPTQKPVALMAWCIRRAALAPGALVFDPYVGSGPVLVAAKRLGMRAIGVEIEERYCAVVVKRLSQDMLPLFDQEAAS